MDRGAFRAAEANGWIIWPSTVRDDVPRMARRSFRIGQAGDEGVYLPKHQILALHPQVVPAARPVDELGVGHVLLQLAAADNAWGAAAVLWIVTGLARVFYGGKGPYFYGHNGFFWTKLGLFGLVFLLELALMTTFVRVRIARRRGSAPPAFPLTAYRVINTIGMSLVVAIVFAAALMARAMWMFE